MGGEEAPEGVLSGSSAALWLLEPLKALRLKLAAAKTPQLSVCVFMELSFSLFALMDFTPKPDGSAAVCAGLGRDF